MTTLLFPSPTRDASCSTSRLIQAPYANDRRSSGMLTVSSFRSRTQNRARLSPSHVKAKLQPLRMQSGWVQGTRRPRSRTSFRSFGLSAARLTCANSPESLLLGLQSAGVRRRGLHRWPIIHRTGCGCGELRRQPPRSAPFHRNFDPPPNGQRGRCPGQRCVRQWLQFRSTNSLGTATPSA